ncbi:MAG: phenylacetate--CoA ligase [Bacteroidaceae bacterium]|jgi:phenylacetate-CoA ligase|nr:phenylacetate--CoA ligase [Bacteroidaceae bacterium]MBO5794459.1 phenylacetate--CoA ligase [Bacteroidaceae bacterium]MEE0985160.1 phenylacetate--CoA ligase [Bacteroidaceae bacterium]
MKKILPDDNSPFFDEKMETMTRAEIEALQLERLQATVQHCMNSPFYRSRFEEIGLKPEDIKSLDDIRRIPFTTKQDLRDTYPFGMASVPLRECTRLHSSSGTTGTPTVILHTQKDLEEWAAQVARNLWMVGLRPDDVFQNSSGYGMFTGGLGFQYGAERLGMLTIPAAAGNSLRQIKFITDFGTTALHAVPSYVTRLYEVMQSVGIDPRRDTKLKVLAIGAEPHSEEQRRRIEDMMGVKAYNSFGMSEMCGPGVGFECQEQNGLHFWEDYYIVEIVDPETLEPVPDGEVGELVLTSLCREAMPLLRYRTRDLTRVLGRTCPCGRNHVRIDRMRGRSDDMMVLRGVNIFPIQIEKILMTFPELASNYLITLTTDEDNDNMTVEVELEELFTDDFRRLQGLANRIQRALKDEILLTPHVKLLPKGTLPVSEGKAVRVVDKRTVYQ